MSTSPRPPASPGAVPPPPAPSRAARLRERLRPDFRRPAWKVAAAVAAVLLIGFAVTWQRCGISGCPDVHTLTAYQPGGAPVLLDRNGARFGDLAPVEGQLVRLTTLPKHVPDAFVAVEDQRFREHGAVDWRRVFGAVRANVKAGGVDEGFSTITMQLARNVFPEDLPGQERTLKRKLLEIRVAQRIEGEFTKDEILELYLNHIYFGNGARGIEAASRHYFGKPAVRLTLAEAAMLAGLPKAPSHYDPRKHPKKAKERRDLVLSLMAEQKLVPSEQAEAAKKTPVKVASRARAGSQDATAAYFVEEVRRELEEIFGDSLYRQPLKVTTTLDVRLQKAAEAEVERQLHAIETGALGAFSGPRFAPGTGDEEGTPYLQGAFVAMDAREGDILAWVGGRDFQQSRFDRVRGARRQTGSVFKPFVYAAALANGRALSELVSDEPISIPLDRRRNWVPKNFDGTYETSVSLRNALVRSKNVATIRVAQQVGTGQIAQVATTFGVPGPIPQEPSMPLGTVSASPLDMTAAYSAFATLGNRTEPRAILKVEGEKGEVLYEAAPKSQKVLDASIAYVLDDVLQEAVNRGTGTAVRANGYRGVVAGKTGTTNDGADAWFIGFTPEVVATAWVGFDQPRPIVRQATGGRVAAPIWARVMSQFFRGRAASPWSNPGGVEAHYVDAATGFVLQDGCAGTSAAYKELFLAGHVPAAVCPSSGDPALYANGLPPGYTMGPDGVIVGPDGRPVDPDAYDPDFATGAGAWPAPPRPAGDDDDGPGMVSYTPSVPARDDRPAANGDTRLQPTSPLEGATAPDATASPMSLGEAARRARAARESPPPAAEDEPAEEPSPSPDDDEQAPSHR